MSNAIATVIMMALLIAGVSVLAQGSFTALGNVSESWKGMEDRAASLTRTDIAVIETSYATPTLDVTLKNVGTESLRDFSKWDVVVQYYESGGTYHTAYLPYTTSSPVSDDQWGKVGIYIDASSNTAEAHQPDILNPSEEITIRMRLTPSADQTANNLVVIGTANGVTVSEPF